MAFPRKGIPPEILQHIRERIDIVEIVSRYVSLKKAGQHFKGLCPFHTEKTPSFTVSPSRQLFHCFGCGQGGDAIAFVMRHERMDFLEAVRELAQLAQVALPESQELQNVPAGHEIGRERYVQVLDLAQTWFCQQLETSSNGHTARRYLESRAITPESIRAYGLGFAPGGWHDLSRYLQRQGVTAAELEQCGLIVKKADGSRGEVQFYDRFRSRLIFPITDLRGRVIAFGGRVLDDASGPKYLNSPETAFFQKGRCLFGLDRAREAIIEVDCALLVEGYFDVIGLSQAGIRHVCAPLGTAVTEEHLSLLRRFASKVVFVFDGDAAGLRAVMRTLDVVANSGVTAQVVSLPEGEDPDSYVRNYGSEGFRRLASQSIPLLEFAVRTCLAATKPRSIEERVKSVDEILRILHKTRNPIERDEYIKVVSECLGIRYDLLMTRWATLTPSRPRAGTPSPRRDKATASDRASGPREEEALVQLLVSGVLQPEQIRQLPVDAFTFPPFRRMVELAHRLLVRRGEWTASEFQAEAMNDAECRSYISRLALADFTWDDPESYFQGCFTRLIANHLQRRLSILIDELRVAEKKRHQQEVERLLREIEAVRKQKAAGSLVPTAS